MTHLFRYNRSIEIVPLKLRQKKYNKTGVLWEYIFINITDWATIIS